MAKINGLGVRLYAAGYDLSADINTVSSMSMSQDLLDITALDTSARKRLTGLGDGSIGVNGWFDNAAGQSHAAWTSNSNKLPTADQAVVVGMGTSRGDPGVGILAKQANYDVARTSGSAIATTAAYESTGGSSLEWGVLLTSGKQTDGSATTSASVDEGSGASGSAPAGYLQVISLGSGEMTCTVQDSGNGSSWSDKLTFTSVAAASAPTFERVTGSGSTGRYIRVVTSGTFSALVFVVMMSRGY